MRIQRTIGGLELGTWRRKQSMRLVNSDILSRRKGGKVAVGSLLFQLRMYGTLRSYGLLMHFGRHLSWKNCYLQDLMTIICCWGIHFPFFLQKHKSNEKETEVFSWKKIFNMGSLVFLFPCVGSSWGVILLQIFGSKKVWYRESKAYVGQHDSMEERIWHWHNFGGKFSTVSCNLDFLALQCILDSLFL